MKHGLAQAFLFLSSIIRTSFLNWGDPFSMNSRMKKVYETELSRLQDPTYSTHGTQVWLNIYCCITHWGLWLSVTQNREENQIHQFSSVTQSCPTLWDPMDCSMPGFPVHHQLPELAQTHVHGVGDTIQPSHPLLSPSPPTFNLSKHQGLFKWVSSSHEVAKVFELQLQHQSFQWIFRTDLL